MKILPVYEFLLSSVYMRHVTKFWLMEDFGNKNLSEYVMKVK